MSLNVVQIQPRPFLPQQLQLSQARYKRSLHQALLKVNFYHSSHSNSYFSSICLSERRTVNHWSLLMALCPSELHAHNNSNAKEVSLEDFNSSKAHSSLTTLLEPPIAKYDTAAYVLQCKLSFFLIFWAWNHFKTSRGPAHGYLRINFGNTDAYHVHLSVISDCIHDSLSCSWMQSLQLWTILHSCLPVESQARKRGTVAHSRLNQKLPEHQSLTRRQKLRARQSQLQYLQKTCQIFQLTHKTKR